MATKKEKILLLIAHRNTGNSFNHRLASEAEKLLQGKGHEVKVVDLYKMKFNPLAGPNDFKKVKDLKNFDYQAEQKYSNVDLKGDNFSDEIKEQKMNILWATTILYQFPLEWLDIPAILKGYVERVYSYYFAYGGDCSFKGKKWMASVTTGGPESMYQENTVIYLNLNFVCQVETFLNSFSISHSFAMKVQTIPMHICYAVGAATAEEKSKMVESYKAHLEKNF